MNNQPRVQKKNKSSKLNAFTLFAYERTGAKVHPGAENVFVTNRMIQQAKEPWGRLPDVTKENFKQRAKELNIKTSSSNIRYNSIGENLEEVEAKKRAEVERSNNRKKEIESTVREALDRGALDTKRFIFVKAMHFYRDTEDIYPAEIAFSKFSLKEGIVDAMSIRINPGQLPLGSKRSAQEIADQFHKYPLPDSKACDGEKDYLQIFYDIIQFLKSEETFPDFVFSEGNPDIPDQIEAIENTKRVFQLILAKAGEYDISHDLKVYPVDELFFYMHNAIADAKNKFTDESDRFDKFSSIAYAHDQFKRSDSDFMYNGGLSCEFHFMKEVVDKCCLSKVKRYGFVIAKFCSDKDKYPIIAGRHYPC